MDLVDLLETHTVCKFIDLITPTTFTNKNMYLTYDIGDYWLPTGSEVRFFSNIIRFDSTPQTGTVILLDYAMNFTSAITFNGSNYSYFNFHLALHTTQTAGKATVYLRCGSGSYAVSTTADLDLGKYYNLMIDVTELAGSLYPIMWLFELDENGIIVGSAKLSLDPSSTLSGISGNFDTLNYLLLRSNASNTYVQCKVFEPMYGGYIQSYKTAPRLWSGGLRYLDFSYYDDGFNEFLIPPLRKFDFTAYDKTAILEALVDDLETNLATAEGKIDTLQSDLDTASSTIDTLEGRLTAEKSGWLANLNNANLLTLPDLASIFTGYLTPLITRLSANRAGFLDNLNNADLLNIPDLSTVFTGFLSPLITRLSADRAGYLDYLNNSDLLNIPNLSLIFTNFLNPLVLIKNAFNDDGTFVQAIVDDLFIDKLETSFENNITSLLTRLTPTGDP